VQIRDRIKELRRVKASELRPSPRNWRTHPQAQQDALRGVLAEVGYADALIARELPGGELELIDGHLRAEITPENDVPVLVLDVDEREAGLLLATVDPLAAMAEADPDRLDALLREISTECEGVAAMLTELAESVGMYQVDGCDTPELRAGDREPFQQMTFTLHDDQAETVKAALEKAKAAGGFNGSPNENSNGNALDRVAEAYCGTG